MSIRLRTLAIAVVLLGAAGALGAALFVWFGVYDISATDQHTRPVYQLLDYAMRRSVKARAVVPVPPTLDTPQRVRAGGALYREHCVQCHGAPGVGPQAVALGLTPAPNNLVPSGRDWRPGEVFWVVKHGIKMSGMPAWIHRLSDEEIWHVVAFVRAMPLMTVADYEALERGLPKPAPRSQPATRPGDARLGRELTGRYVCATCHVIPGFVSATAHVGPPLNGAGTRAFIGGVLPNTRENMVRWLMDPRAIDPRSAMPALGITEQEAHDIAAFMATLDSVGAK
jgi:mono/diheme cytochrome c family protein